MLLRPLAMGGLLLLAGCPSAGFRPGYFDADSYACGGEGGGTAQDIIAGCTRRLAQLELDPDARVRALRNRATAQLRTMHPELAIPDLTAILKLQPGDYRALADRGVARGMMGDIDGAVADMRDSLVSRPSNDEVRRDLIGLLRTHGRAAEVPAVYDAAVAAQPRSVDPLMERARARAAGEDWSGAAEDYTRALELRPDLMDALMARGRARIRGGDLAGGLADYQRAVGLQPGSRDARINYGNALLSASRPQEALAELDAVLISAPNDTDALQGRGRALLALNRAKEALAAFDRVVELQPDRADTRQMRGLTQMRLENPAAAVAELTAALERDPRLESARASRGVAYVRLERWREALADLDQAIAAGVEEAWFRYNRGRAHEELRQLPLAEGDYRAALAKDPGLDLAKRALARVRELRAGPT